MKHDERKCIALSLHSVVILETSHISFDDRFAAMQIELLHPGVEEAVGSHEVDLTSPISSRTMSCPKRLPAQDIRIVSQLCFYAQEQIGNFHSSPPLLHPISWTRIFTNANMHVHDHGHAYSQTRTCVFTNANMHFHADAPIRRATAFAAREAAPSPRRSLRRDSGCGA